MSKPKVLLLGRVLYATESWAAVSKMAEILSPKSTTREEFLNECRDGHFDGVVATYGSLFPGCKTSLFDEELIKALPTSLKYICHNAAGYDRIDVHALTARSIRISNVPTAVNDATADTTMFLILGALRGYSTAILALREGHWQGHQAPPLGHDPQGKLLGILGMGGIGKNLAMKAQAFGMRIQYHNRTQLSEDMAGGAEYVGFEDLLATSDVLSLNLPLNKNTRHIISTREFEKMKSGVTIVNTSRGAVIDEEALVRALGDGKVWSAGLDVFENEPKIHPGLMDNRHVMLLPHMGTYTVETRKKMEEWNIDNITAALETGKLKSPVWEQANM